MKRPCGQKKELAKYCCDKREQVDSLPYKHSQLLEKCGLGYENNQDVLSYLYQMEPFVAATDKKMFYKYLDRARVYFEFGSGGSTFQASARSNVSKVYSVESDRKWHDKLKEVIR